ncbi:MAG: hypothetical protein LC776_15960, partial [Acidobacteria bacterium]|nr:hypothetical protein [Acidobacteriota bacterium]
TLATLSTPPQLNSYGSTSGGLSLWKDHSSYRSFFAHRHAEDHQPSSIELASATKTILKRPWVPWIFQG